MEALTTKELLELALKHLSDRIAAGILLVFITTLIFSGFLGSVHSWVHDHAIYVFFGIVGPICYLATRPFVLVWNEKENKRRDTQSKQKELSEKHEKLNHLTREEKAVLAPFIMGDLKTRRIYRYDAVAQGLEMEEVLYAPDVPIDTNSNKAYNLHGWARRHLKQNPHLWQ